MTFDKAIEFILEKEGGYVHDPRDAGGETNYGISKRSFPDIDIKNLTKGHAKHLYEVNYWNKLKCPGLPASIRLCVFDCGVNQGTFFAAKSLQETIKAKPDGIIGPKTINACHLFDGNLLSEFALKRVQRYFIIGSFDRFGKGWINRLTECICFNNSSGYN